MSPAGFEPSIPTSQRPKTQALECAATGIGIPVHIRVIIAYQDISQHEIKELQNIQHGKIALHVT
jgi:hypothetical protein